MSTPFEKSRILQRQLASIDEEREQLNEKIQEKVKLNLKGEKPHRINSKEKYQNNKSIYVVLPNSFSLEDLMKKALELGYNKDIHTIFFESSYRGVSISIKLNNEHLEIEHQEHLEEYEKELADYENKKRQILEEEECKELKSRSLCLKNKKKLLIEEFNSSFVDLNN